MNVKINIETLESNTVVFIDFNSKYFDLIVLNLNANILQDNRIKAEPIQNGSNVSSDKIPYQIEEKIKGDSKSKSNLSEKIEDISESKMSNDLFEKNSEEVKVTQDKSIQPNSENSSNNVNLNLLSNINNI